MNTFSSVQQMKNKCVKKSWNTQLYCQDFSNVIENHLHNFFFFVIYLSVAGKISQNHLYILGGYHCDHVVVLISGQEIIKHLFLKYCFPFLAGKSYQQKFQPLKNEHESLLIKNRNTSSFFLLYARMLSDTQLMPIKLPMKNNWHRIILKMWGGVSFAFSSMRICVFWQISWCVCSQSFNLMMSGLNRKW